MMDAGLMGLCITQMLRFTSMISIAIKMTGGLEL